MRTWGQIRQILRQRFPSLEMDLLNSAMQTAYNDILDRQDWTQLVASGYLRTLPRVDTVGDVTAGSITVVGVEFLEDWVGRWIRFGASASERYRIVEYSLGNLLLDRPYDGATATGQAITIYQPIYSLPIDTKSVQSFPAIPTKWTREDLEANGRTNELGEPYAWIPLEGDEQEQKQVELYPAPTNGASFAFRYVASVRKFDGSNTQEYPLSWVSDDAILAKATAICCVEPAIEKDPTFHLAQYSEYLERMTVQDAARSSHKLRMDPRHTRHDRERLAR